MPKIAYIEDRRFTEEWLDVISRANQLCAEYERMGYTLTLRQLYYQFVARDWLPNTLQSYKRLGAIVDQGRLAGRIDWHHITDNTRNLMGTTHWDTPGDVIRSAHHGYRLDKWVDQDTRVEVWVEKDALSNVIGRAAREWDLDYFACRGNVSQSEMWNAGRRFLRYAQDGQDVVVLHLGDHDPNGIDMTRDIRERLERYMEHMSYRLEVRRIALNHDQIAQYNPPPNPVKWTDSRATGYAARFGDQSWELDALPPDVLHDLITDEVAGIVDTDAYDAVRDREETERELLSSAATRWAEVAQYLQNGATR